MTTDQTLDTGITNAHVAVIGGGVGGTYAAWRTKTGALDASTKPTLPVDPADRRVVLIEGSGRIGGRLESMVGPGTHGLQAEFGGMGFTSNDQIFTALVDDVFHLDAIPFPMPTAADLLYVRGVHLTMADARDPSKLPYRLTPTEQQVIAKMGPGGLVPWACEQVIPGCATFSKQKWEQVSATFQYRGQPLRDIGFWNLLLQQMSNEAFTLLHDAFGHFFEVANWNAAQAMPWFLLDGVATYRTLANGYDELPKTLASKFEDAGGVLQTQTPIERVDRSNRAPGQLGLYVQDIEVLTAERVILAMPRRSLELIADDSIVLNEPSLQPTIQSVTGQQVMKIFMTFDHPWWNALGISSGASSSDLPLGQCWYFDPPSSGGDALLMASYNDTLATAFWEGLTSGPEYPITAANPPQQWVDQCASQAMVDEVLRQLGMMHQTTIPLPTAAAYMDWSLDPFGGAFYTWNVGVDAPSVEATMLHPDPSVPLHVCGSAYSSDQGWAEGALDTAEQVMQQCVGLAAPSWL